jgi:hypothetical protein
MARYIDAEEVCEALKSMASVQLPDKQSTILGVVSSIENFPTADVAPRAEIAREIFEEIRDLIRFTMEPYSTTLYAKIEFEKLEALRKKYRDTEPPKGGCHE